MEKKITVLFGGRGDWGNPLVRQPINNWIQPLWLWRGEERGGAKKRGQTSRQGVIMQNLIGY